MPDDNPIEPTAGEGDGSATPAATPSAAAPVPAAPAAPAAPAEPGGDSVRAAGDAAAAAAAAEGRRFNLTQEQLSDRIAQARRSGEQAEKARLKEIFGTDDPAAIKALVEEHKALKAQAEKDKRARMTREQQLEADLAAERKAKEDAITRARQADERRLIEKQNSIVERIASQHVNPKFVKLVSSEFKDHLRTLPKKVLARFGEQDVAKWFEKYAKSNPELARAGAPAAPRRVVQKPVSTGPKPEPKPAPNGGGSIQGKTPRPGQANSMSKQEYQAYLKSKGLSY